MTIEEARQSFLAKLNSGALTPVTGSANQAPPSMQPPAYPAAPNPFLRTPLPSVAVLQPDMARQFFNPATPQFRSLPPTPSSNPAVGAAVLSNAPSSTTIVTSTGGMIYRGIWTSYTVYVKYNVVLYNSSAYIAAQTSQGAEPDISSTQWTLLAKNLNFRGQWAENAVTPVQLKQNSSSTTTCAITFTGNVTKGNILLALCANVYASSSTANVISLADSQGNTWTQINSTTTGSTVSTTHQAALFFCVANATGANTVTQTNTVSVGGSGTTSLLCLEYLASLFGTGLDTSANTTTTNFTGTLSKALTPSAEEVVFTYMWTQSNSSSTYTALPVTFSLQDPTLVSASNVQVLFGGYAPPSAYTYSTTSSSPLNSGGNYFVFAFKSSSLYDMNGAKYHPADVVEYLGSTYICTVPTSLDPLTGSAYWAQVSQGAGYATSFSTSYTAVATDYGRLLTFDITSAATLTLPATPPLQSWWVNVANSAASTAVLTVSPNGLNLDGSSSSLLLTPGEGFMVFSDGANYWVNRGFSLGGVTAVTGGGTYTALASDHAKLIAVSASAATVDLPATPPSPQWRCAVQATGVAATVSPNGLDLDGSTASLLLAAGQGSIFFTDGSNYFSMRGMGQINSVLAKTGSYNAATSDSGKLVTFTSASAVTYDLAASGAKPSNWIVYVENLGAGVLTLTADLNNLDGSSQTLLLTKYEGVTIFTDGSNNYFTIRGASIIGGVNSQTSSYAALSTDNGKMIVLNKATAITLTLPSTPPVPTWTIFVQNIGAGTATVSPNGLDINGSASSLTLTTGQGMTILTDGSNYFASLGVGGSGSGGGGVNSQTGTTYTILSTDLGKLVTFVNTSAIAVTLPVASTSGFGNAWYTDVQNIGAPLSGDAFVTITPTTSTIDGAATLVLQNGSGCRIFSDGTNYWTNRGAASLTLDNLNDYFPGRLSQYFRPAQFTTDVSVDNAGFVSTPYMVNGAPPGWYNAYLASIGAGFSGLSYNTSTPYVGSQCLQITGISGVSGGDCAQQRVVNVMPGETYEVSGWVYSDGTVNGVINLIVGSEFPLANTSTPISASANTANTWVYVSNTGTIPTTTGANGPSFSLMELKTTNHSGGSSSSTCLFQNIRLQRIMGASGTYGSPGLVPDPGQSSGSSRFLREDATWQNAAFNGGAVTLAAVDSTGLTSSVGTTNFSGTGAGTVAGMYTVQGFIDVTTAGSAGTVSCTIGYTTDSGTDTQTSATISLATLGTNGSFTISLYSAAGDAISYATTVASVIGSPVYTLHLRLIQLAATAPSQAFSGITSGTNTAAAMIIGAGASLATASTGTNAATSVGGITVTGTPSSGQVLTATSSTAADWAAAAASGIPLPNTNRNWYWQYDMGTGIGGANPTTFSCGGLAMTMVTPGGGTTTTSALFGPYVGLYSSTGTSITSFSTYVMFYPGSGQNLSMQTNAAAYMSVTTDVTRVWLGFTDQTIATMCAGTNPAGNYACFRYVSGTDTHFQCITKDGTTQNVIDSGVTPSAGYLAGTTPYNFSIVSVDGTPSVLFYINGSLVATSTSHLPTAGTPLRWVFGMLSTSAIGLGPGINYLYIQAKN